ncbi:MAG TPA: VOC family protein, partial [Desulfobacteria bacterium]|nr:VOC family protein [Desulfobacteria bacterium]
EEAMNFYMSVFKGSEIVSITRCGANEPGKEGSVLHAVFSLKGQEFMCMDSSIKHDFTFTPAMSLCVNCDNEDEIVNCFQKLSQDGQVLMPLEKYPTGGGFGWVEDKYGVSWQLTYEEFDE